MAVTKANLRQMQDAIQNLSDALPMVTNIGNQADDVLAQVQVAWRSPSAAGQFQQKLTMWQSDHQELKTMLNNLAQMLGEVYADLQKKEVAFSG